MLCAAGQGCVEECLQDARLLGGFSDRCRQAVEERMERKSSDYRLNAGLR
jgi:hypothetical protein